MELADLQHWEQDYRAKAACFQQPDRCQELYPAIAAGNARLAAVPPSEFRAFVANLNRNDRSLARVTHLFEYLQQMVTQEQTIAEPTQAFISLLGQELALWRKLRQELQDHCACTARVAVIGYGEITTSLVLDGRATLDESLRWQAFNPTWVFKGLPPFPDAGELARYARAFTRYSNLLQQAGLVIPQQRLSRPRPSPAGIKVYVVQRRLEAARIGNVLVRALTETEALALLRRIVRTLGDVFRASTTDALGPGVRVGVDGQISNWYVPDQPEAPLLYLDTSTPLLRVDGVEQINPEIFLKNTPGFMRAVIRRFFLQDVLDRYYDFRRVLIDMIANLYKEGRGDLVAPAVATANALLAEEPSGNAIAPLTVKEIRAYYQEDAFIWRFFQTARRIDRFVTEKVLRKKYPFRLPGKIAH